MAHYLLYVFRQQDGQPLSAMTEKLPPTRDADRVPTQCKHVLRAILLERAPPARITVKSESGEFTYYILVDRGIGYLSVCEARYAASSAFRFLEEVATEFQAQYGGELDKPDIRPYQYIRFERVIQSLKKTAADRAGPPTAVTGVVQRDIYEVLQLQRPQVQPPGPSGKVIGGVVAGAVGVCVVIAAVVVYAFA